MNTTIRTESNLVEVVTVKEKPDRDPEEKTLGQVWIWQEGLTVDVEFQPAKGVRLTRPT